MYEMMIYDDDDDEKEEVYDFDEVAKSDWNSIVNSGN